MKDEVKDHKKPVPHAPHAQLLSLVFRPVGGHAFSISLLHKTHENLKIWIRANAAAQLID